MKKITLLLALVSLFTIANAQTAEKIIEKYIEATGGQKAWEKVESIKMTAETVEPDTGGILEAIKTKDGKRHETLNIEGNDIVLTSYNGETAWGHSFFTMEAEKRDSVAIENLKRAEKEFPIPFLNYKEKGYSIELLGDETKGDVECFKIKLTKSPFLEDGEEKENFSYHYFDKENFLLIAEDRISPADVLSENPLHLTYSDYREIDGVYFPSSMAQSSKRNPNGGIKMVIETEINFKVDESIFVFPEAKH